MLREASRQALEPLRAGVPQARPLTVVQTADAPGLLDVRAAERPPLVDIVALRRRMAALRDESPEHADSEHGPHEP